MNRETKIKILSNRIITKCDSHMSFVEKSGLYSNEQVRNIKTAFEEAKDQAVDELRFEGIELPTIDKLNNAEEMRIYLEDELFPYITEIQNAMDDIERDIPADSEVLKRMSRLIDIVRNDCISMKDKLKDGYKDED